jgi:hypothetical protein
MERCLGEVRALDLPDDVRDNWLYANAAAFFFGAVAEDRAVSEA